MLSRGERDWEGVIEVELSKIKGLLGYEPRHDVRSVVEAAEAMRRGEETGVFADGGEVWEARSELRVVRSEIWRWVELPWGTGTTAAGVSRWRVNFCMGRRIPSTGPRRLVGRV